MERVNTEHSKLGCDVDNPMKYSIKDLQMIDSIEFIRRHPENYLGGNKLSPENLIGMLVSDILTLLKKDCLVIAHREEDWWLVSSECDWIQQYEDNIDYYFTNIVPFPEACQNSFHSEVLLTAFCENVVTFTKLHTQVIKGTATLDIDKILTKNSNWSRCVAFKMSK